MKTKGVDKTTFLVPFVENPHITRQEHKIFLRWNEVWKKHEAKQGGWGDMDTPMPNGRRLGDSTKREVEAVANLCLKAAKYNQWMADQLKVKTIKNKRR